MARKTKVRAEYISLIGYDPFADDPSATVADVAARLEDYKQIRAALDADDTYPGWTSMQSALRDNW